MGTVWGVWQNENRIWICAVFHGHLTNTDCKLGVARQEQGIVTEVTVRGGHWLLDEAAGR